jgi:hypothetical protein
VHNYEVGAKWNEKTGLQKNHWFDGVGQKPSDIVNSTRCDEDSEVIWEAAGERDYGESKIGKPQ